jgi:RimJ/RimL family protein N-acetyltransferase
MEQYRCLEKQTFVNENHSLVPLRWEDRVAIMHWRNSQMYHLRQSEILTAEAQDQYFSSVITKQFEEQRPQQILFSFMHQNQCIGYGGLVHIDWGKATAEVSFIMDTALEKDQFEINWSIYLKLIEEVAFESLHFVRINTYTYDLRPHLYPILIQAGFIEEQRLKKYILIDGTMKDVLIHGKINTAIAFRKATSEDESLTYSWASNPSVRKYSFQQTEISPKEHREWFQKKITDSNCLYLLLIAEKRICGSIRFDKINSDTVLLSFLIDPTEQGKGYGTTIVHEGQKLVRRYLDDVHTIQAEVMDSNEASHHIFRKLDYEISDSDKEKTTYVKKINS